MAADGSLKRVFLRTLIVALVSSAVVGIYTFLFGKFGETEAKVLLTTLSISYFSVTSLACAAALERRAGNALAVAGLMVSVIGFLLFMPGIWAEWSDSEAVAKLMVILSIFAFSIAQVCLLALVALKPSLKWVLYVTASAVFALAALSSGMISFEWNEEWLFRFLGVLGIVDGCGSLLIPVLARLTSGRAPNEHALKQIELICPSCGHQDVYPLGTFQCVACPLEIRVEIHEQPKPSPVKKRPLAAIKTDGAW